MTRTGNGKYQNYPGMLRLLHGPLARLVDDMKKNGPLENTVIVYLAGHEGYVTGQAFSARAACDEDSAACAPIRLHPIGG